MNSVTSAKQLTRTVFPIVLCGGAGSRLWPMSRPEKPKQFHTLVNDHSLLANTIARMPHGITGDYSFEVPIVLGNQSLEKEFRAEINAGDMASDTIILEPVIRDTAPAIAAATAFVRDKDPEAYLLVVPSDARIDDQRAFEEAVLAALELAVDDNRVMTIGIKPTRPDTQYGYIELGEQLGAGHVVTRFHEKPNETAAQSYIDAGCYVWNAGMFLFRAEQMARLFENLQPKMWSYANDAVRKAGQDGVFVRLEPNAFSACDRLSMDYAIMEKADRIGVVEARFDWDDLGSWAQLYARAHKDENQNAIIGTGLTVEARKNYIRARGPVIAVAGIDGLTVVAEDDKVLVVPTEKSHLVKSVTSAFKALQHSRPGLSDGDNTVIRNWLFECALPFWIENGLDRDHGGVHEALNFDGTPAQHETKRLRVLPRQIYCFAHAKTMGWDGDAAGAVQHCFDTLVNTGWHADSGWVHRFKPDGSVHDDTRDMYDQCFCLLAFAWMIRANIKADEAKAQLDRTIAFLDTQLANKTHGGFAEAIGATQSPYRRANPHMHYLEAMLALYDATSDTSYLDRADHIIDLFDRHFYDPDTATLTEFFQNDWTRIEGNGDHARVEPGHHYEWAWLLLRYLKHRHRDGLEAKARTLFSTANAMGHHGYTGAAADSMMPDGTDVSVTARCWPQTEALKAAIAFEKCGLAAAKDLKKSMLKLLFERYLDGPIEGGWYDRIDETGRICAVDMPSSTFYHVYCALAEYLGE